jgi:zinc transporter ZupT
MFSFVAGMMVYISIRELLPTALRYDPKDSCVTACAFWGMAVMAASLLLFELA